MKRWIFVLVPTLILSFLIGLRLHQNKVMAAEQQQQREMRAKTPPMVSVTAAQVRDVVSTFESVATVDAPLDVKLASKITGRVIYLDVQPGARVRAGEVIAKIDPTQLQAQIREQQATIATAQDRLAQAAVTKVANDVSVNSQVQQQEAAVASSQANLNQVAGSYNAQVAAADAAVTDVQGKVNGAGGTIGSAEAAIRNAQANLENANAQYAREHNLFSQGFVAAQDLDTSETAVKVQKGGLDVAQAQYHSAKAALDSANAELVSAQKQAEITRKKGLSDIAAARAQVTQSMAALQTARANTSQKPAYEANLAALRASVAAAQGSLADLQAQLGDTEIKSPMDGFVSSRLVDPGTTVTPGQTILGVRYIRQVWITVPVPDDVLRKITMGQEASLTFDGLPGRPFKGVVSQIPPSADPISREFPIRITLNNDQGLVKPGMFAHVSLMTDRLANATVVPPEAIQKSKDGTAIFVVDAQNIAHRTPAALGAADSNGVAVLQGIRPGDRVVVLSGAPLKDGQEVRLAGTHPGTGMKAADGSAAPASAGGASPAPTRS